MGSVVSTLKYCGRRSFGKLGTSLTVINDPVLLHLWVCVSETAGFVDTGDRCGMLGKEDTVLSHILLLCNGLGGSGGMDCWD